jgi:transposase-like protein
MKCPKCEQKKQQYKNGKTKAGSQRYRCWGCGCSYTPDKKDQGYDKALMEQA